MLRIKLFNVFLLIFCSLLLNSFIECQDPSFNTDGGATFIYEGKDAGPGECQTCLRFYSNNEASKGAGYFRYFLVRVFELKENAVECCGTAGSSCPYGVGCNNHAMYYIMNFFTTAIYSSPIQSIVFSGNVEAPGAGQEESCVNNVDNYGICVPFRFNNTFISENSTYSVGSESLSLKKQSVQASVTIRDWPFEPTSIGLRLKVLLTSEDVNAGKFYLQPGNYDATKDPAGSMFNTFNTITLQDEKNRQGSVELATFAVLNSTNTVKVNISGLYPHEFKFNARYIYIDIPRSNLVEYSVNIYLPQESGVDTGIEDFSNPSSTFFSKNKTWIIVVACIVGALALCMIIIALVIKCR